MNLHLSTLSHHQAFNCYSVLIGVGIARGAISKPLAFRPHAHLAAARAPPMGRAWMLVGIDIEVSQHVACRRSW